MSDIPRVMRSRRTIHDVAEATGLSSKTVSFVLNGKAGVAEATRQRVLKVVNEMHYRPHVGARALRDRVTRSIGVIFPAPAKVSPLSRSMLVWLYEELIRIFGSRGYYVTFDMAPHSGPQCGDYARGVWEHAFGPCFIAGPLALDDAVAPALHAEGIPYVCATRLDSLPECSAASVDYEQAAYLSVKYLLERGHTRIGMLTAFQGYQTGLERRRGYERALREADLPVDDSLIRWVTFDTGSIVNSVHALLGDRKATALIDSSSMEAPAMLHQGAHRAGRRMGQDFEAVVWTYRFDTVVVPEAAAHMCLPLRQAAAEGLEWLAAWIEGRREGPVQILYPPTLAEAPKKSSITSTLRVFDEMD